MTVAFPEIATSSPTSTQPERKALPPARARAVLFDLDGTLLDTAPDLIDSLNALRGEEGLPPVVAGQLATVVSHGSALMIRRGFDLDTADSRFEPLRQRFLAIYRERLHHSTRPFPGMAELLDELDGTSIPWGIVTNKPGWLARPLIAALGLASRSACLVTGDNVARRKPDPYPVTQACTEIGRRPADCVVVGDAQRDIESGRRAGTLTLAALFGYVHAEDDVCRWGADGLIGHPADVLRWVAGPNG